MNKSIFETFQNNKKENVGEQFRNFINNFSKQFGGMNPAQLGPQLVANGVIPQNVFDQEYRPIANMVTGLNK